MSYGAGIVSTQERYITVLNFVILENFIIQKNLIRFMHYYAYNLFHHYCIIYLLILLWGYCYVTISTLFYL